MIIKTLTIDNLKIPSKTILAIDPGKSTGFCLFKDKVWQTWTYKWEGMKKFQDYFLQLYKTHKFKVIVIERFVLYPNSAHAFFWKSLEVSELIGAIKYFASSKNIEIVEQNTPGIKKTSKQWVYKFSSQHEKDAFTHASLYILDKFN